MIKYCEGTIFNVDSKALVNTVNCMGVMGAGIALEFMLRYPEMYNDYKAKCKANKIKIGSLDYYLDYYQNDDGPILINFPTKRHFKYPSKITWIEQGLQDFIKTYKDYGITSVAFPKLGTNKGGLNWDNVKEIMVKCMSQLEIQIYICLDIKQEAEGLEKRMLDYFNLIEIDQLADVVKLNKKQRDYIQSMKPYDRFWKIAETDSIGIKTYSLIFKHFYKMSTQTETTLQQGQFKVVNGQIK